MYWANCSLLSLYSHRNAWANLHLLGQPDTSLAQESGEPFIGQLPRALAFIDEVRETHRAGLGPALSSWPSSLTGNIDWSLVKFPKVQANLVAFLVRRVRRAAPCWCTATTARTARPPWSPPTVRVAQGRLSALNAFHRKSVLYGAFAWERRALNRRKWWFPARAVMLARAGQAGAATRGCHRLIHRDPPTHYTHNRAG
jgi:hypothetical protein